MAIVSNTYLKSKFETGDIPTQQDFEDLIDTATIPDFAIMCNVTGNTVGQYLEWGYLSNPAWGNLTTSNTAFVIPSNVNLVGIGTNLKVYLNSGANYSGYLFSEIYKNGEVANVINDGTDFGSYIASSWVSNPNGTVAQDGVSSEFPPLVVSYGDTIQLKWDSTDSPNIFISDGDTRHSFWIRKLG